MLANRGAEKSPLQMPQQCEIKVLIFHADPLISAGLAATLTDCQDFTVMTNSAGSAVSDMHANTLLSPDVVVADLDSGLRLIASNPDWKKRIVILTHNDSEAQICQALEQGARGYLLIGCTLRTLAENLRSVHAGGIALDPLVATRIADRMTQPALTRREREILGQLMLGLSNKRIASNLALAQGTVKTHIKSILNKLEATTRTEAVVIAQRRGILGEAGELLSSGGAPPLRGAEIVRRPPEGQRW